MTDLDQTKFQRVVNLRAMLGMWQRHRLFNSMNGQFAEPQAYFTSGHTHVTPGVCTPRKFYCVRYWRAHDLILGPDRADLNVVRQNSS